MSTRPQATGAQIPAERVPAFKAEPASGHHGFLALQAALSTVKAARSLAYLAGSSGDAFKFVYDRAPVREPLRDLRPWDSLALAAVACGLRAEWVPGATLDHVRGQVEAHAKIGQPVLTSGLPGNLAGGFCLLVGYDEASDTLSVRDPASDPEAAGPFRELPLHAEMAWDGPRTGAPHWIDYPLLVLRGPLYDPPDEAALRRDALQRALAVLEGDPLPYPDHPGALALAGVPLAGRAALQGPAGLEALAADLAESDLADPAVRWRLDAQLGQLAWDRHLAVLYLETWGGSAPGDLIAHYRTLAHTARTLLSRNAEQRSAAMHDPDDLTRFIEGTAAYCYALPDRPRLIEAARGLGHVLATPGGPVVLVDSPKRRESAAGLAARLAGSERAGRDLLAAALARL